MTLFAPVAYATSLDEQISALKQQAANQQAEANKFASQANDYQGKVNQLNAQIGALVSQIYLNEAEYDKVTAQIAENQGELDRQKKVLGDNLKSMYINSSVTPLEMLVSSKNLSDYFNQQQYQDSIKDKIQNTLVVIAATQKKLDDQKQQVAGILADEKNQQAQLDASRAQVNQLLAVASQNVAAANAQVQQSNSQIASLRAQQVALIASSSRHVSGGSGCGGYPQSWCSAPFPNSLSDDWGMYQRQCVSYAAWATADRFGHNMPYWGGVGDAKQWPGNADKAHIPRDSNPRVGDVAIYMGGEYGHAMIVEEVHGSTVRVSSFNGDGTGHYSVDDWPVSSLTFIHFR